MISHRVEAPGVSRLEYIAMKKALQLGLTWFWTGGLVAIGQAVATGTSISDNPKTAASAFLLGGIAGVLNHVRTPPQSGQ